mgnify:CR=1 FL=1
MTKVSFTDMTEKELNAFIARVEDAMEYNLTLEKKDLSLLFEAFKACLYLQERASHNDLTIKKLKKLLGMVSSSEKLKDAMAGTVHSDDPKPDKKKESKKARKKPEPVKAEVVHHKLEEFSKGDCCPECSSGKLYKFEPASLVRVTSESPFKTKNHISERLRCNLCENFFAAKLPKEVLEDGGSNQKYGYTARSLMSIYKYFSGMPFFRQETLQSIFHCHISASSIFDQSEQVANMIKPVFDHLKILASSAKHFHLDDTTNKILEAKPVLKKRRGSNKEVLRTGVYSSGLIATLEDKDIVLFQTNIAHAGEFIDEILDRRKEDLPKPKLMSDAASQNKPSRREVIWCLCNAHARRQFFDLIDDHPDSCRRIVSYFDRIFENERIAKNKKLKDEERLAFHKEHSFALYQKIISYAEEHLKEKKVEPISNLGKAIKYLLKHKSGLMQFCFTPGAKLDNNKMEAMLKLIVLGRKNHYFFKSSVGAAVSDTILSVIATAKSAKINVFEYLTHLQRYSEDVRNNPDLWVPWNYSATLESIQNPQQQLKSA